MSNLCVLITGANRGLGLEFVRQFVSAGKAKKIFATCRNPENADQLLQIAKANDKVHIVKLDVTDYKSYPDVVNQVTSKLDGNHLNLLINNAGIYIRGNLETTTAEGMIENYNANTVAPLMLTKAFLPLLQESVKNKLKTVVINITSKMGSIEDNTSGSFYAYRASKAALNMVTRSLATDLKPTGILAVALHPGWVQTDMGGKGAPLSIVDSVSNMMKTIENVDESVNGLMINYNGIKIPW